MEEFSTITHEQLKEKIDQKADILLVDTLGRASYELRHIPGAIMTDGHADDFVKTVLEAAGGDKQKEVIVYCSSFDCHLSPTAAKRLVAEGFTHVIDFAGGLADWIEAGYPVAGSAA